MNKIQDNCYEPFRVIVRWQNLNYENLDTTERKSFEFELSMGYPNQLLVFFYIAHLLLKNLIMLNYLNKWFATLALYEILYIHNASIRNRNQWPRRNLDEHKCINFIPVKNNYIGVL